MIAWRKLAELCSQYLQKGSKVYIEGRLKTRSWDTPEGEKKYRTEVVANEVVFLDRAPGGSSNQDRDAPDVPPEEIPFE